MDISTSNGGWIKKWEKVKFKSAHFTATLLVLNWIFWNLAALMKVWFIFDVAHPIFALSLFNTVKKSLFGPMVPSTNLGLGMF